MKLTIEDSKTADKLNILFTNLSPLSEYVNIYIEEVGLHMQGMDSAHVCLFDVVLTPSWFTTYEEDKENDSDNFCVPARIFNKVLSTYKSDQSITLEFNGSSDKLIIEFAGGKSSCDKYFELPLICMESDLMNVEKNDEEADMEMTSKKFTELVSQFEIFDSRITFVLSEEKVLMTASGDEGSMRATLSLEDEQLLDYGIIEGEELSLSFSLEYIKRMTAFNRIAPEVKLEFKTNSPLFMTYDLGEQSVLQLILAPKIDD